MATTKTATTKKTTKKTSTKAAAKDVEQVKATPEAVTPAESVETPAVNEVKDVEVTEPVISAAVDTQAEPVDESTVADAEAAPAGQKKESHKVWIGISEKQVKPTKAENRYLVNLGLTNKEGETSFGYVFVGPKSFAEKDGQKLLILPKDKEVKLYKGSGENCTVEQVLGKDIKELNRAYIGKKIEEQKAAKNSAEKADNVEQKVNATAKKTDKAAQAVAALGDFGESDQPALTDELGA